MKSVKKKICSKCSKELAVINFYNSNSPLFRSDGKIPFCKTCLKEMVDIDDINSVKSMLRLIDKPFLKDIWAKSLQSNNHPVGEMLRQLNSLHQYRDLTWADSQDVHNGETINHDGTIHNSNDIQVLETEDGSIKVTTELKTRWGGSYTNREYLQLEKLFEDMTRANHIESPQHKKQLEMYCKLNIKADRYLEADDFKNFEIINRQLQKLTQDAGFRGIDKTDSADRVGIRTFSQIFEEVEKDGFIEPYDITERQDFVDRSIQYILNYQLKLMNMEQLSEPPSDTPKQDDSGVKAGK